MKWDKQCVQCGDSFLASGPAGMYCSMSCGQKYRYKNNMRTTEYQYSRASGNWKMYYTRRVNEKGRSSHLTVDDLLRIHEAQGGKCALTGVEMTCRLEKGNPCFTNASIDRIEAGGSYSPNNIQLVCVGINRLRGNLSQSEYIAWCIKVADFNRGILP